MHRDARASRRDLRTAHQTSNTGIIPTLATSAFVNPLCRRATRRTAAWRAIRDDASKTGRQDGRWNEQFPSTRRRHRSRRRSRETRNVRVSRSKSCARCLAIEFMPAACRHSDAWGTFLPKRSHRRCAVRRSGPSKPPSRPRRSKTETCRANRSSRTVKYCAAP